MDGHGVLPAKAVEYPTRDGRPMGETDDHRDEMKDHGVDVLKDHFEPDPMVYVSGNNFVYYVEGDPTACVSPDTYVVKGVEKRQRDTYKVWEEGGRVPCFVLEITSKKTRMEDMGEKMAKYRDELAVPEYFLFDPRAEWVSERLRGFRLAAGVYQPIAPEAGGRLASLELGLELGVEGRHLRFYLPGSMEPLPTRKERVDWERAGAERERARAERERACAERERARADAAEEELRRLRAELERRGGGAE